MLDLSIIKTLWQWLVDMRAVESSSEDGVAAVNWLMFPAFIAHDSALVAKVDIVLGRKFSGKELTDSIKDSIHSTVVETILSKYPLKGLPEYLKGMEGLDLGERTE